MQIGKKEFIAGLIFATISTSALVDLSSLHASAQNELQSEIKFSRQLGLFDEKYLHVKSLEKNISEAAFQRGLNRVLHEAGVVKAFNQQELAVAGITSGNRQTGTISRQNAAETILRAIMFSWIQGALPHPEVLQETGSFKDWQPEEKYRPALAYAIKTGIIMGTAEGTFNPGAKLKVREAIILLKRLHDTACSFSPSHKMGLFTDVVQDHYMTTPLLNLRKAGAFDLTDLGRRLNGTGKLSAADLSLMIQGILGRLDRAPYITQIKHLQRNFGNSSVDRKMLARMAEILINALPHGESNQHILYSDVKKGSELENSLNTLAKAGIRMGYNNNTFAGNEKISRFEALGLLNRIITELEPVTPAITGKADRVARTDDFDNYKKLLIERKARIKKILNRE